MTADALPDGASGAPVETPPAAACGALLREARERAGLGADAIAQQLKLHPRQVQAIEEGRFDLLPGRTFVRGFVRNYARAVQLDPEPLLAMLPGGEPEALAPTGHTMGEIRFEPAPRRPWARWAIPLALVTLVALAAAYEYWRPGSDARRTANETASPAKTAPETIKAPAPALPGAAPTGAEPTPASDGGTPLPNPLATAGDAARAEAPSPAAPAPAPAAAPSPGVEPAPGSNVVSTAIPPGTPGEPTLVIVYGGRSWTEVRDANGKVLLSLTGTPGMTQSVTAPPPLEVVIGSVADVSMRYRGAPVDLGPYRKANVARLRLD